MAGGRWKSEGRLHKGRFMHLLEFNTTCQKRHSLASGLYYISQEAQLRPEEGRKTAQNVAAPSLLLIVMTKDMSFFVFVFVFVFVVVVVVVVVVAVASFLLMSFWSLVAGIISFLPLRPMPHRRMTTMTMTIVMVLIAMRTMTDDRCLVLDSCR